MRHLNFAAQALKIFVALALLAAAGCGSTPADRPDVASERRQPSAERPRPGDAAGAATYDRRGYVQPLHMRGAEPVRVGLLLPFTASSTQVQKVAASMFDAAQLATFEAGDEHFLLIPKDTRGTAEGAEAAAKSALADGAEILLGPLFSEEVTAVTAVSQAAGVPVVAFSSDVKSAGSGVYLLSYPPELEIERITDYSVKNGLSRFALIAPENDYGARVSAAFSEAIYVRGGVLVHEERYEQDPSKMLAPARRLAAYARAIIPATARAGVTPTSPTVDQVSMRGYQAVLMPEQGTLLRALAPLLPYYNVDINQVKLLGISAWQNPRLTREPALRGGWFAAPDPDTVTAFEKRFAAVFGATPPRLATLSYDATLLAARLAQNPKKRERFTPQMITNPNGYYGAGGLFRLKPDGAVERGLAILEIQPDGFKVIDPAAKTFAPGS